MSEQQSWGHFLIVLCTKAVSFHGITNELMAMCGQIGKPPYLPLGALNPVIFKQKYSFLLNARDYSMEFQSPRNSGQLGRVIQAMGFSAVFLHQLHLLPHPDDPSPPPTILPNPNTHIKRDIAGRTLKVHLERLACKWQIK